MTSNVKLVDVTKITDPEIEGIDKSDYPDFVDAYISAGTYEHVPGKTRDLSHDELDYINDFEKDYIQQLASEDVMGY